MVARTNLNCNAIQDPPRGTDPEATQNHLGLFPKEFRSQFNGLTLADFYKHDYYAAADPGAKGDKVAAIRAPPLEPSGQPDYEASIRGIRKNLILLDMFVYGRRFEPFFERAKQAVQRKKTGKD